MPAVTPPISERPSFPDDEAARVDVLSLVVRARGRVFQRCMARLWQADRALYERVVQCVSACDEYLAEMWNAFFDERPIDRLRSDATVIQRVADELAVIEVIVEIRPRERGPQEMSSGLIVTHKRAADLKRTVDWSLKRRGKQALSLQQLRALTLCVWIRSTPDGTGIEFDAVVSPRTNLVDIDFVAEHFEAAMRKRDVLQRRGSIDRAVVSQILGSAPAVLAEGLL